MKILHTVEFYYPSVGGAQEVVRQLSEHMALLGHDVTVATTKIPGRHFTSWNGVKIKEFAIEGNDVRGIRGEAEKYKKFVKNGKFDVIMNYAAQQWATDLFFSIIDNVSARKVIVPCGFSGLYDPSYKDYFSKLKSTLKKYDASIYLSHVYRDIAFAKKHHIGPRYVVPNGVDEREFKNLDKFNEQKFREKHGIPEQNRIVLCVSNHTGQKGHSESIQAFKKTDTSNVSLVFVGDINLYGGCYKSCMREAKISQVKNYIIRNNKTIHVIHCSRKETLRWFKAADVFLFLSNIECSPLVLFEASAAGLPFIASEAGNSQEIAQWLGNGVIIKGKGTKDGYTQPSVPLAARALEKVMAGSSKYERLGAKARTKVLSAYTWEKLAKKYIKIYGK